MEDEGERGVRLSKRFSDKGGEVDLNTKAGTAWSHNFLNQKPWHPLSYPNQRRKWIAEQTHVQRQRRAEEVAREFAQEQEFFRQTALVSQKEKEKMEMMKAVSFMYVRPPGYNAESAKAAEIAEETKKEEEGNQIQDGASNSMPPPPSRDQSREDKKKSVPKDVFGRALPTAEQFEVLKNAPRLETGAPARPKPFAVEIRNVKCLRCGKFGHQSGDRECPLKDTIMPNEESRLQRDDPLTAMMAHAESSEPLKWELKQKPGMSPPRGGFDPDDPNQQIVAEDIFDEYGGFLGGEIMPDLLANFTSSKPKKKSKDKKTHKRRSSPSKNTYRNHEKCDSSSDDDEDDRKRSKKRKLKSRKGKHSESSSSDHDEMVMKEEAHVADGDDPRPGAKSNKRTDNKTKHQYTEPSFSIHKEKVWKEKAFEYERTGSRSEKRNNNKTEHRYSEPNYSSGDGDFNKKHKEDRYKRSYSSEDSRGNWPNGKKSRCYEDYSSFENDNQQMSKKRQHNAEITKHAHLSLSDVEKLRQNEAYKDDYARTRSKSKKVDDKGTKHRSYGTNHTHNYSSGDGEFDRRHKENRHRRSYSSDDSRGNLPNGKKSRYCEKYDSLGNDDKQRSKKRQHNSRKTNQAESKRK